VTIVMLAIMRAIAIRGIPAWTARTTNRPSRSDPNQIARAREEARQGVETDALAADSYRAVHEATSSARSTGRGQAGITGTVDFIRFRTRTGTLSLLHVAFQSGGE
jgi:hypothetical protein